MKLNYQLVQDPGKKARQLNRAVTKRNHPTKVCDTTEDITYTLNYFLKILIDPTHHLWLITVNLLILIHDDSEGVDMEHSDIELSLIHI